MEPLIGMIVQFAGNFAPKGWALYDGTMLPIMGSTAFVAPWKGPHFPAGMGRPWCGREI
jgi:hypothetical protein